ncbi:MAG: response regulator [Magnetococcus sp. YQC-5]
MADIKILLGDPNQTGRRIVKEILTRFGATVETAENSQSLIDIWHRSIKTNQHFDLILLDHGLMPHPDTLLNQICHAEANKAKILFLLPTHIQNSDQPGAPRFHECHALKKPVKLFGLLKTIDRMLNRVTDAQETKNAPSSPSQSHVPLRILLVEDIENNQKLATTLLQQAGHTITLANNGRECLQKLQTNDFDLVLMDMRMPEMDGFEATRHIRMGINCGACDPKIPIVACTSRAMREEEAECLAAGMNGYLRKPYHAEELFKAIEPFARKRSSSSPKPARNPDAAPLIKPVEDVARLQSSSNTLLLEGAEHIRLLQTGLHEKRVDQVLKEVEWLKTTAANIGAIRLKTLTIRLKGTVEVHDWAESLDICTNLELEFRKISKTLTK